MNIKLGNGLTLGIMAISLIATSAVIAKPLLKGSAPSKSAPVVGSQQSQNLTRDKQQIIQAANEYVLKQAEREYPPEADTSNLPPVKTDGITLVRPYALVEWFWGGMGGQALLVNQNQAWQVVLADNGALSIRDLSQAEIPNETAQTLIQLHQKQSLPGATKLSQNISPELRECIPSRQVATAKLAGTAKKAGITYYLLAAYPKGSEFSADLLLSTGPQDRCLLLYYRPWGELVSLSRFAPNDVVRSLALQRLKNEIDQTPGGKAGFQEILNSGADIPPRRTPEEVWALKQLGFHAQSVLVDPEPLNASPEPK